MTKNETITIISAIVASFPNYKPADLNTTVEVWQQMLKEYTYEQVSMGLQLYISQETSGFAPSIGQIIDKIHIRDEMNELSALEAWSMVYKAICNSNYNADQEFARLPETIQKAIGNPDNLREMAQMDTETVQSVEQSHFIRAYNVEVKRAKENAKIPRSVMTLLQSAAAEVGKIEDQKAPDVKAPERISDEEHAKGLKVLDEWRERMKEK